MYAIIIQKPTGQVVRETEDVFPDEDVLKYWEDFYKDTGNFSSPQRATVINMFEFCG